MDGLQRDDPGDLLQRRDGSLSHQRSREIPRDHAQVRVSLSREPHRAFDEDKFAALSPITRSADAHGPMLFIQGDADKVCPPDQSEMMVEAIRAAGDHAALVMIPDEAHGFVRAKSNPTSPHAEERFYREVFDL